MHETATDRTVQVSTDTLSDTPNPPRRATVLEVWKEALEKHGLFVFCDTDDSGRDYIAPFLSEDDWLQEKTSLGVLCDGDDDHSAAEFTSRTTEKCFGPCAFFVNLGCFVDPCHLATNKQVTVDTRGTSVLLNSLGSGASKLDCLLSALQTSEVKK